MYERSGSRVKHTLDEGCQPQLLYLLFTSKNYQHISCKQTHTHTHTHTGLYNCRHFGYEL